MQIGEASQRQNVFGKQIGISLIVDKKVIY